MPKQIALVQTVNNLTMQTNLFGKIGNIIGNKIIRPVDSRTWSRTGSHIWSQVSSRLGRPIWDPVWSQLGLPVTIKTVKDIVNET